MSDRHVSFNLPSIYRLGVCLIGFEVVLVALNLWPTPSVTINRFVDLDGESALPTWFSSMQLMLIALTGVMIRKQASVRARSKWTWPALIALFTYLSIDETATVHESFGAAACKQFGLWIWNDHSWMIMFAPLILIGLSILVWAAFREFRGHRSSFRLLLSGTAIWLAALSCEVAQVYFKTVARPSGSGLAIVFEEFAEMLGATLMWCALLLKLRDWNGNMVTKQARTGR